MASIALGLLCCNLAVAQGGKLGAEADEAFQKGFYFSAIELYKRAYTQEKKAGAKAELIFKVGETYRVLGDHEQAAIWFERANKAQYDDPITYLYIGDALKQQGKYAEAIAAYNKYKEKRPNDVRADQGIAASQMAQKWMDSPARYDVSPEVLLNTAQYDFSPAFADRKNEDVVFTSTRQAATGTETDMTIGENFSDLFFSSRDRLGKWSEPQKLPPAINTPSNEGGPAFNSKRTILYFTRCQVEKKKVHGCDIWISKKVGNNYSEPEMLALKPDQAKGDTAVITVGHPSLSHDDDILFFASNMPGQGARGGRDIWMVRLDKDGKPVGKPTNLGPEINTNRDEMFPHARFDGSLYFSSNGHTGMGGLDIYRAEKTGDNTWGQVENMKAPINSSWDDFGVIFDGEHERGYFTSNRPGGKGMDDIWRFYMPDLVFAFQGTAYNKVTGEPLPGTKISVVGTDGSNFSALTDDNGGFEFAQSGKERFIKENTSYTVLAERDGYLVVRDQFTTVGLTESTTFVKEYFLQPPIDKGIPLPQVLYDVDQYVLTAQAQDSLEILYQTLVENPTIVIELRSHTDSRQTRRYKGGNLELSQKRAQSVVNYLVTRGIDPARMVPVGRGAEETLISDAEIAKMATREEKEAAHQRNRRTDFKILSFDHVPKDQAPPGSN